MFTKLKKRDLEVLCHGSKSFAPYEHGFLFKIYLLKDINCDQFFYKTYWLLANQTNNFGQFSPF